ncbi:hypothetical protein DL96DRAFT_1287399 [Flagelloscypha sp. PMI_526]|nr:hypothetical protein DL96DRAFT_1287399 [Flagelloscypha sp. PMI_526]
MYAFLFARFFIPKLTSSRWPSWSEDVQEPIFATFNTTSTLIHPFFSLPFELLIEVFVDTTPYDVLNMASTCRAVRQLLLSPYIFRALLQAMVHRGSLFWLNPSPFAEDEVALANESLVTWINSKEIKAPSNPFQVPSFPFLAFVHTCFVDSFSMRSRRRLWGIIKQVERRWTAFRNGMQLGGEDDPDKWEWTDDREYYDPDVEDFRWRYH